jgi:PAP2 superfamily protein
VTRDPRRRLLDFITQIGVVIAAYYAWRLGRGQVDGSTATSVHHANQLVDAERWLHSFVELDVQKWTAGNWIGDVTAFLYAHMHFWGSIIVLLYVYFFHRDSFGFFRNAVIIAMGISLLGYWLYPTAPPRFVDGLGFSVSPDITGNEAIRSSSSWFFNPYAAVPSMHVGLATIFGFTLARLSRPLALKVAFACYPLLMTFVVISTGNHFWLDAAAGALTAALALGAATLLSRVKPAEWSLLPAPAEATA